MLHFVDKVHVIKDNLFDLPPLFKMIHEQSHTEWREMYQVFNMGHRMELYVPAEISEDIIRMSKMFHVDAKVIGKVEASEKKKLTIRSPFGEFIY